MGSCAAPSAKGDDKFITTDYLQQCPKYAAMVFMVPWWLTPELSHAAKRRRLGRIVRPHIAT
ncbi:hypothetical protein DMW62_29395 [Serratia marcescens]|uniref:Replication initiator protein n=1 Tax=Serratia marcescens TaxID=615 RepID=A0ABX5N4L8_SERMA|nr:hypothetical protein CW300_26190 [Serratia marcescens]PYA09816.1 hypothetical protein DMW42_27550 [Serratia marcescens]PYA18323.1 hypothetical protein DMW41_27525 [Serratia marcescens]PYA20053.1 hypothetical protein DMW40_27500 [Serratia marcescens]PYA23120.1 hypothetical protein DMW50_29025 [Serratia marcescens]